MVTRSFEDAISCRLSPVQWVISVEPTLFLHTWPQEVPLEPQNKFKDMLIEGMCERATVLALWEPSISPHHQAAFFVIDEDATVLDRRRFLDFICGWSKDRVFCLKGMSAQK